MYVVRGGEETPVHTDRKKCGSFLVGSSKKSSFNKSVKQAQKDGVHKVTKAELEKVKDRSSIHGNHLQSCVKYDSYKSQMPDYWYMKIFSTVFTPSFTKHSSFLKTTEETGHLQIALHHLSKSS